MNNKIVSSEWIKSAFLLGVLGFMGYTTWHAVYNATNNNVIAWLSLFLFDAGAFASYRMYIGDAEGAPQRTAAKWLLWIDFILAAAMVAGALDLFQADTIKYIVWISAGVNGAALYYYETHSPALLAQFQTQDETDSKAQAAARNRRKLFTEAMQQADANIMRQARQLGALMAQRAQAELKHSMRLPMTADEVAAWNDEIIDAEQLPAPADYIPAAPFGFWDYLKAFFTRGQRMPSAVTPSQQDAPQPSPSDEPAPAPQDNPNA